MRRALYVAMIVLAGAILCLPAISASAAGPVGSPPGNGQVLAPGHVPGVCQPGEGYTAYGVSYGYYWSEYSHAWIQAPWCYPRWGYLSMSGSQIASAGDVVTATLIPDMGELTGWIEAHYGAMSWSHPGSAADVVSGCGLYDMTCSVRFGTVNNAPAEWVWGLFHVSGPGRVFWLPPSYAPRCQPCIDTITNAWSMVGMRPANASPPTADFTFTVDGGSVDFHATSTDPSNSVLFHEWSFDDNGATGTGVNPSHTYTAGGTYHVTLTSTNAANLSDSITKDVTVEAEPLSITQLAIDPTNPEVGEPATATIEVRNSGADPVTAITPIVTVTPPDVIKIADGEAPPTFDLAPGASNSFELTLDPVDEGEAFINVLASGLLSGSPTSADAQQLAFDVGSGELLSELKVTARAPNGDGTGGAATVEAKITNSSGEAMHGITADLVGTPEEIVDISVFPEPPTTLADGASMTAVYDVVVSSGDPVELHLDVEGRRDSNDQVERATRKFLTSTSTAH